MVFLYIICAVGISSIIFARFKWIKWQPSLLAAFFLALLVFLSNLNSIPFWWLGYQTLLSQSFFIFNNCLKLIFMFSSLVFGLTLLFGIAEGLTRITFTNQPYIFSSWKEKNANSNELLHRTLLGYVLAGFNMVFVISVYLWATTLFGWWTPSYALVDPNIFSTYVPALTAITMSLWAGITEECLFRAVPLATATLFGRWIKQEKLMMAIGLLVQAFIFGAAHASYPAQPFYARLFELMVPSLVLGLTYLSYGLVPVIVFHVMYDLVWFSLPIFIADTTMILLQQLIIIIFALLPLIPILYWLLKTKTWHTTFEGSKNSDFPPVKVDA
jgi:hypothetical protein